MIFFSALVLLTSYALAPDTRPLDGMKDEQSSRTAINPPHIPRNASPEDQKPNPNATTFVASCGDYWYEKIAHQGKAPFHKNTNYTVYRNVKDYGAKGDGITDDTYAIQEAMADGGRCAPFECTSTTTSPAVLYFPEGIYMINTTIDVYYYTQMIGNPKCGATIKATANFKGDVTYSMIDANPYRHHRKDPAWLSTTLFFRQIRNLNLDTTQVPANVLIRGLHWPIAQATSLQNLNITMNEEASTQHTGIFIEEGSGGFMLDLRIRGGRVGLDVGSQQFTTRNLVFENVHTAIHQEWNWGWTYKSINIANSSIGIDISSGASNKKLHVGSMILLDSVISDTRVGILTGRSPTSEPDSAGSVYLENVITNNVNQTVSSLGKTVLDGSSDTKLIRAWSDGHRYLPFQKGEAQDTICPSRRPGNLVDSTGRYVEWSKPQYEHRTKEDFVSTRNIGAIGDGKNDDTGKLQEAIDSARKEDKILFVDAGVYRVTNTVYIPPGSRIVGEGLASVILSSGDFFNNASFPRPVVQVGRLGDIGRVEWSDMFVSTKGRQEGAILIEYNLASFLSVSGIWDVHTRIGGFTGSDLQVEQCLKKPEEPVHRANVHRECMAAFMSMHITKWATGLYMENAWLWTADHDLDDADNNNTHITVYTGRGLFIESMRGMIWLYGTAVEHHQMYQYLFANTTNIFVGHIQSETPYYQPNPGPTLPFSINSTYGDHELLNRNSSWGLRIGHSSLIFGYGAGLYSFFDNYDHSCSREGSTTICQDNIFSIIESYDINIYNLNTVGTTNMVSWNQTMDWALSADNNSTLAGTINVFRLTDPRFMHILGLEEGC